MRELDEWVFRRQPPVQGWRKVRFGLSRYAERALALLLLTAALAPVLAEQPPSPPKSTMPPPLTNAAVAPPSPGAASVVVVLADFDNRTRDAVFDRSLTQALLLEVSQSPFLTVLTERRVADALRALDRAASAPITASVGRQICLRTGSQDVVEGAISSAGSRYEIELKAVNCNSGAAVAEAQVQATTRKEVLHALHEASSKIRLQMGESLTSVRKFDVPAQATTASLEALREYSLGLAARRESGDVPSIPFFKRALARDPSFPMVKATLAGIYGNLRQPSRAIRYASEAYALRNRVGARERFHIAGAYFLETGQIEAEILNYKLWQKDYPNDSVPYNNLGNDYAALGQLDKSLVEYQAALRIAPSVVGYTNVAGMELALNRYHDADSTLDEAFASKLDGRYLHQTRYWVSFVLGDVPQMNRQVAWAAGKPGDEDSLLSMESDTEAYFGRLTKARLLSRQAVESAIHAGSKETAALWQVNEALREAEVGSPTLAKDDASAALALSRGRDVEVIAAFTLARVGESTEAAQLVRTVEREYATDSLLKLYWLPTIRATIQLDGGHTHVAVDELRAALPYELGDGGTFINYVYPAYVRGLVYLRAHDGHAASVEFQKLLDQRGTVVNSVIGALAHMQLGRAYAMEGDTRKARAAYQEFFALWKSADSDVPVLLQAKREYESLQSPGG